MGVAADDCCIDEAYLSMIGGAFIDFIDCILYYLFKRRLIDFLWFLVEQSAAR